jgi:membrane protein
LNWRRWLRYANPFSHSWRRQSQERLKPSELPTGRFVFARVLVAEWNRIDAQALASQVAYSLIFAVPSLFLFLMSIAAVVDRKTGIPVGAWLQDTIESYAPDEIKELLDAVVNDAVVHVGGGLAGASAILAILIAIWGASGGINALINACNRAYGVPDTRSFLAKRVLALVLTAVFTIFILVTSVLFIGGDRMEKWVVRRFELGNTVQTAWEFGRFPAIVLSIAIALFFLYTLGPVVRPPVRWAVVGAASAAGLWILLLWGFRGILSFIDPGTAYGATGSVIVFLFFLRLTGMIFILGAALIGLCVREFRPVA